jgi:ADP-heptose:LPS heptosyltransferase
MARTPSLFRHIDRIAGIPVVATLGATRQRRALPMAPARIGVLQPTALGDAVLSSGVVARLAKAHPEASLTVLHGKSNASAMGLIDAPFTAKQIAFNRPHLDIPAIRQENFDLVVDLTPWPRLTAIYAAVSGAVSVGFDSENQARAAAFDVPAPHSCTVHEIINFAGMADLLTGPAAYTTAIRQDLAPPERPLPYEQLVLCHPCGGGSQAANRHWPPARWGELIRALTAEGFVVGITGGPPDATYAEAMLEAAGVAPDQAFSLCGAIKFGELAAVIQRSRLVVSIDTGVLHLAAAMNAPIVAVHGPSKAERWGPAPGSRAIAVMSPHPDAGYVRFGFETRPTGPEIMPALPATPVIAAARTLLATEPPAIALALAR